MSQLLVHGFGDGGQALVHGFGLVAEVVRVKGSAPGRVARQLDPLRQAIEEWDITAELYGLDGVHLQFTIRSKYRHLFDRRKRFRVQIADLTTEQAEALIKAQISEVQVEGSADPLVVRLDEVEIEEAGGEQMPTVTINEMTWEIADDE